MFIIVEGRNYWTAEVEFVRELKKEASSKAIEDLEGSQAFLAYIRAKPEEVDFLFVKSILPLIDSRSSMSRESREACYWFAEHRKAENEHIILSDIYAADFIDARIRRLITHRVRVISNAYVHYRIMSLTVGRVEVGKLGEQSILEAIEASNRPLTPEEIEQRGKELEQALGEVDET